MKLLEVGQPLKKGTNVNDVDVPAELRIKEATGIDWLDFLLGGGFTPSTATMLTGDPASGKCLGLGTQVLMFDGTIKAVENVVEGDLLMGPDSQPRRVLTTTRGRGQLYMIIPIKGDPWICNDAHVLTLINSGTKDERKRRWKKGQVIDIPISEYLSLGSLWKSKLKQFTVGVDFPQRCRPLPIDPYFLGFWYGDGNKELKNVGICKPDPEVEELANEIAREWGLSVRKQIDPRTTCPTYFIRSSSKKKGSNPLLTTLRDVVRPNDGRFPHEYLTASRDDRAAFLAGILDADGCLSNGTFDIVQKQPGYAEGICFLARSLGFRALCHETTKGCQNDFVGRYWRVTLSGDFTTLPLRIQRRKPQPRTKNRDVKRTGFDVKSIGLGEYAGFQLDGDGRFLLGDFTVTHNSTLVRTVADALTRQGHIVLYNCGEEAPPQVRMACERLGLVDAFIIGEDIFVDDVLKHVAFLTKRLTRGKRLFLFVDSLQYLDDGTYDTGKTTKRTPVNCAIKLIKWVRENFGVLVWVHQVTKGGVFVGDNQVKHAVDVHLHFGFDRDKKSPTFGQRVLRVEKNRYAAGGVEPVVVEMGVGGRLAVRKPLEEENAEDEDDGTFRLYSEEEAAE